MRFLLGVIFWVVVLLAALVAGGAAWLLVSAGVLENYPEQDLDAELRVQSRVLLHVNPDHTDLLPWWDEVLPERFRDYLRESIPYEGYFALAPDRTEGIVHHEFLLNTRRLSGVLNSRLNDRESWRWWAGQRVQRAGFTRPGIWRVYSTYPIGGDILAEAGRRWVKPVTGRIEPPDSDAPLSVTIDNRDGSAFLALAPILNPAPQPGDLPRDYNPIRYAEIFSWFQTARAECDALPDGGVEIEFRFECEAEHHTHELLFALEPLRDYYEAELARRGLPLRGAWQRIEGEVVGRFTIPGLREALLNGPEPQGDPPRWPLEEPLPDAPRLVEEKPPFNRIVLVSNETAQFPLDAGQTNVAVLCTAAAFEHEGGLTRLGATLGTAVRELDPDATEVRFDTTPAPWQRARALAAAQAADVVVLGLVDAGDNTAQHALAAEILATGTPAIVVGFEDPRVLEPLTQADTLLYSQTASVPFYDAAAEVLYGKYPAEGKLLRPIGSLYPAGHGITPW